MKAAPVKAELDWERGGGLLPAVVQHARDGRVLMLGYMNREALETTLESGWVTFYSRRRQCLWTKGETSGHRLKLVAVQADCDRDALLVLAEPQGPVCHTGAETCFETEEEVPTATFLVRLDALIAQRARARPAGSYTVRLFESGTARIAQKVGEESVETALAAVAGNDEALLCEAADLFYHLLVLLRARGLGMADLSACLQSRQAGNQS